MIRTLPLLIAPLVLAACSEAPAQEAEGDSAPTSREIAAAIENAEPSLAPADRDTFAEKFAAACPSAKAVNKASCRAQGMGSRNFVCEYSLGDDEFMRHEGVLSAADGEYVLDNPEKVCAQGA